MDPRYCRRDLHISWPETPGAIRIKSEPMRRMIERMVKGVQVECVSSSYNFATVRMTSDENAQKVLNELQGKFISGRKFRVWL